MSERFADPPTAPGASATATLRVAACPFCHRPDCPLQVSAPSPDARDGPVYHLFTCPACEAAFVSPLPDSQLLLSLYPAPYYGEGMHRPRLFLRRILGIVNRWLLAGRCRQIKRLRPRGAILDMGCGRGEFLDAMQQRGWDAWGVEPSASARGMLPAGLRARVVTAVDALPPTASRFDVICLWHVFEHLSDPVGLLSALRERLSPDGVLFLAVPHVESWEFAHFGPRWFHLDLPRHLRHYSVRGLERLLAREGFELRGVNYFAWGYNAFGLLQSVLNQLTGKMNVLYNVLKRGAASGRYWPPGQLAVHAVANAVLAPPLAVVALAACIPLGLAKRSGTIEVWATPSAGHGQVLPRQDDRPRRER